MVPGTAPLGGVENEMDWASGPMVIVCWVCGAAAKVADAAPWLASSTHEPRSAKVTVAVVVEPLDELLLKVQAPEGDVALSTVMVGEGEPTLPIAETVADDATAPVLGAESDTVSGVFSRW